MLDAAVGGEIENRLLAEIAGVQVTFGDRQFIADGFALGHDFPGRRDDGAGAHQLMTVFIPRLGHPDHPGAVLVGSGLHGEQVVEIVFGFHCKWCRYIELSIYL